MCVKWKACAHFVLCSESGSITAELLVRMLAQMDTLELFDRSDGLNPFLILEGHGWLQIRLLLSRIYQQPFDPTHGVCV